MSRYIDADALIEKYYKQMDELMESTSEHVSAEALSLLCGFTLINSAPSIDIVRCAECIWRDKDNQGGVYCTYVKGLADINDESFCSWGRKENTMSEEAIYKLHRYPSGELEKFKYIQKLIRCKECKWVRYCETEDLDLYLDCDKPDGGGIPRSDDWYCADGEREGE